MKQDKINFNNQLQDMRDRNEGSAPSNEKTVKISLKFEREDIIQGLLYSEILGKPRSKRKRR